MTNSLLADLILFIHFLIVLGVVMPLVLIPVGWRRGWPWVRSKRLRALHAGMMGFVVFEILFGVACPLTVLENHFLESAGKQSYQNDFIAHWVSKVMYWQMPYWAFVVIYLTILSLIVFWWRKYPPRAGEPRAES